MIADSSTDQDGGKRRAGIGQNEVSNKLILMTDKFVPSEGHNELEIMTTPTSVGFGGWGPRSGPHSREARAAPILYAALGDMKPVLITIARRD